jgi:hypothetical protein
MERSAADTELPTVKRTFFLLGEPWHGMVQGEVERETTLSHRFDHGT